MEVNAAICLFERESANKNTSSLKSVHNRDLSNDQNDRDDRFDHDRAALFCVSYDSCVYNRGRFEDRIGCHRVCVSLRALPFTYSTFSTRSSALDAPRHDHP